MISHKLVLELKQILETDYGLKLSLEEVYEIGSSWVSFIELLIKIEQKQICKKQS
jgi:hypothetical protein